MANSREPENQPPERCSWPPRPQITWPQAVTLHQRLAGLGFQGRHDDGPGVPGAVRLQVPLGVEGGGAVPGAVKGAGGFVNKISMAKNALLQDRLELSHHSFPPSSLSLGGQ